MVSNSHIIVVFATTPYRHSTKHILDILLSTDLAKEAFDVFDVFCLSNVLGISEDVLDCSLKEKL